MQDLTQGSITRHLLLLAAPIAIGMVFQTLYHLIDVYFVAQIGDAAVAGVSAAGNVQFIVMALTQVLAAGTMVLIAQATGRKDRDDASLVFNQSLVLAAICALAVVLAGALLSDDYMALMAADAASAGAGTEYLYWFTPGLALQFALVAMGAALRGTGIVRPTVTIQMATVILNALLAPVLIAGWITGVPLGVAGAGLASSLAIAAGVVMMTVYFVRKEKYVRFHADQLRPRLPVWRRVLHVGVPPGAEFALIFIYTATVYWAIRGFGPEAQAGFGIGSRVMQAIFLPAMAIAFATAPVAGQNYGAGLGGRVRETFRQAAWMSTAIMLALTLACQVSPEWFVARFIDEPEVVAIGGQFLHIISWNFIAAGLIFSCSGLFQGMGNTLPSLYSGATRLLTFVPPALVLSTQPWFTLRHLWWLSVVTLALQALFSLWLLAGQFKRRLATPPGPDPLPAG